MLITRLDNENADRNLTTYVTVLTHTPDATKHTWCQAVIKLGDGTKNLDGTGGAFLVKITVGGQTLQPSPQTVTFGTEVRSLFFTVPFMVPGGDEVVIQVQSPNGADTDVDVTASLYDVGTVDVVASSGNTAGLITSVDGVDYEKFLEMQLAFIAGECTYAAGTIVFMEQDGSTACYTIVASEVNGSRAAGATIH